jgi:DNA repair protein RadA/Sms
MAKAKKQYVCASCYLTSPKWIGQCPQCNEWNTFVEEEVKGTSSSTSKQTANLTSFSSIQTESSKRITTDIKEWDRVMGGGILPGSFIILTGDPGIGKSTLLLQVAHTISQAQRVFYFSSEESLTQVKKRALRIGIENTTLLFSDQSNLEQIIQTGMQEKPDVIILDSLQNCQFPSSFASQPGSVAQLREAGFILMRLAKEHRIAVIITGHVTKEGYMAGPKILEHMVDAVFYLQGADQWNTRILRSVKNRFGAINELGFFEMHEDGMREITDINKHLIGQPSNSPGTALTCELEGSRPLLMELQALCVSSKFGVPQRVITGIDPKQVILIAAILEKHLHVKLSSQDIFFKVSGGVKVKESASDLCIALALLSSYFQKPLPPHAIALGEMTLAGKIKPINHVAIRIKEATTFGVQHIIMPYEQKAETTTATLRFKNIYELLSLFPEDN